MARGAAEQQNLLNTQAGSQFQTAQSIYGGVTAQDQATLANPGYSAVDKGAMTSAALDPIAGTFDAASQEAGNRATRTRNDATLTAGQDQLARSKGEELSQASGALAGKFADTAMSQKNLALNRQASLYGPAVGSTSSLYGNATQAMSQRKNWADYLQSGLSDAAGATAGIMGALKK